MTPDEMTARPAAPPAIRIADYDPAWPGRFAGLAGGLRAALGPVAERIDHIGSMAVPGLAAKPIIDIQISVAALEPGTPTPTPRCRTSGSSSGAPTNGPSRPAGSRAPATPSGAGRPRDA